ncbi:TonB-dependent receptor [Undibacterium sp. Di24W]|uniref:TonB-dependent receptor n=1 Tax=Undibacterium sp. Di24W TaxID=3413033 RepID=UPI003BEFFCBF
MQNKTHSFKKTLLAHALVMAFGVTLTSVGGMQAAYAQSNATGTIYGKVDSVAGATIAIQNTDTGLKRILPLDAAGRYTATALPAGHYKVDLLKEGKVTNTQELDIIIGQGVEASFVANATQTVTVSATRSRIDVSNTNNGAIFTGKELAKLPMQTNLTAIVLLAPNTTKGDAAYGNVASFGGGGVSENAYYINGLPVTNPLSQIGSTQLPWGAISQTSIITGGFGAEFGRSIGGVMNVTTKSGTNNWETGVSYSITPNSLRSKPRNIYFPQTGSDDHLDGTLHFKNDASYNKVTQYGAYLGGPLVQDKLFMFAAVEKNLTDGSAVNDLTSNTLARDGWLSSHTEVTRYLAKFDWNISDDHRVEWTSIGDNATARSGSYGYNVATGAHNTTKYTETISKNFGSTGADSNALKYTGQLTDALTLTALVGQLKAKRGVTYFDGNPNGTIHSVASSTRTRVPEIDPNNYVNKVKYGGSLTRPGDDDVKSYRLDLEYKWNEHTFRAGIDRVDLASSNVGVQSSGGGTWVYNRVPIGNEKVPTNLSISRPAIVANYGGYGTRGYYVTENVFSSLTQAGSQQTAQYFEDRYQATKNLLIVAGLRNDQYNNTNGDGEKFVDMKNQLAPRLSASWDVNGDSSMKVFGSAGRYFLQMPTRVSARAASRSTLTRQDFTYTGVDSNGQPLGLRAINEVGTPDGEIGQTKDPRSVVSKGLKPNYQDEFTLGLERAISPSLNLGAKFTYRNLGAGIDDDCDTRVIAAYSKKVGLKQEGNPTGYLNCFIFNPGRDATIWVESHNAQGLATGNGRYVTFTAAELGFPKAERKYVALDFFAEHPLTNGWYGKLNYTWSRSAGNMEGQTNSDTGQQDVSTTANWDFPEFMAFTRGVLPNDRTHAIKAFGFYEFDKEWSLGANLLIQSGRPKTCQGTDLDAEAGLKNVNGPEWGTGGYGAAYMWCNGKPAPRGSLGRMPTESSLDLSLTYKPVALKGIVIGLDVFNVSNQQMALTRRETYDGGDGAILSNYGEVRQYAPARTMKLRVEYNHRF